MRTPCYQCPERHELCHAECGRYREWTKQLERRRAERMLIIRTRGTEDDPAARATRRRINEKKRRGR